MPERTIKHRIILGIGALQVVQRPRALQRIADTNEHHIVHVLYSLQKSGLVEYKKRRNADSPGMNLMDIKLTPKGHKLYEELRRDGA